MILNSVELAVFVSRLSTICEEMGLVLQKSALSPNIKDRLDYSCAFFDAQGKIAAQAAHIPVHLGSMAYAMAGIVASFSWEKGDVVILNDPFKGGTHLPDVTVLAPFFEPSCLEKESVKRAVEEVSAESLLGFVACRAHHANIGCEQPGSMPLSESLSEEGVLISPVKLYQKGEPVEEVVKYLSQIDKSNLSSGLPGDFIAQLSAINTGILRLSDLFRAKSMSSALFKSALNQLNQYGRDLTLKTLAKLPKGQATFEDYLDDDGYSKGPVKISLTLSLNSQGVCLDFSGTSSQVRGNINCPESVCAAAAYYVFACLLPDYVPHCHGVFQCIELKAPKGSLLNANPGAAVAAGNVETSMRIVDVVLGALAKVGVSVPAAAQGTMNNIAMGSNASIQNNEVVKNKACKNNTVKTQRSTTYSQDWNYYETIGGGMGAGPLENGMSAVQCHMTNSLNTPVESMEMHYPIMISNYSIRRGSGGVGQNSGGDGIVRGYYFKERAEVSMLTDRRLFSPWGMSGGGAGKHGLNILNGQILDGKVVFSVDQGDELVIHTPGGGAYGELKK